MASANLISALPSHYDRKASSIRHRLFALAIFSVETFNTAGRVHEFLLASEEGVTLGADFQAYLCTLRGACLERFSTGTNHIHFDILGVNFLFHEPILDLSHRASGVEKQEIIGGRAPTGKLKSSNQPGEALY